jgi:hypothetical protein
MFWSRCEQKQGELFSDRIDVRKSGYVHEICESFGDLGLRECDLSVEGSADGECFFVLICEKRC